jgi:hypothetical protein
LCIIRMALVSSQSGDSAKRQRSRSAGEECKTYMLSIRFSTNVSLPDASTCTLAP